MIKHIFSDIDGTLFVDGIVTETDVEAVHRFVENKGIFSVATGRSDYEIKKMISSEKLPDPFFRVSGNGVSVYQGTKLEVAHKFNALAKDFLHDIINEHIDALNIVEVQTTKQVYFHKMPKPWALKYKEDFFIIDENAVAKFKDPNFPFVKLFLEGDPEAIAKIVAAMAAEQADNIEYFYEITGVNVNPKNISKGSAIKHIMETYNLSPNEIAVIGDAANDVSMFDLTPNSFTFHHALPEIQATANYVVESVAEAIEQIMNK